jgi:GH25 family lysozyme M1 (1,4-beta-N-acetylmuramidase)
MADALSLFDVSKWQSGAYAGGGGFVGGLAKLGEGVGYKDDAADRHVAAILAQPIVPGGYHFGRPDLNPGTAGAYAEADWFWRVAASYGGAKGMLLALDAESAGGSAQWCDDFLGRLSWRSGGYNGLFYSYWSWMQTRGIIGAPLLQRSPLWFAWPDANGGFPIGAVAMQQYGLTSVPGISGSVDANRFFGSLANLKALTVGGGAAEPRGGPMFHPTIAGRWDDLVVGSDGAIWHTWGASPTDRATESWGGAGIPGTEWCGWTADGSMLLGRVVGVDARIYYRAVKGDGGVLYDWTAATGESAELPPSGSVGATGPPGPAISDQHIADVIAQRVANG